MKLDLVQLLRENTDVTDFRIIEKQTESYETFFVHRSLETVRTTDTTRTNITVYVDHGDLKGDSSFLIYATTTQEEARQKIAQAVEKAKMIENQHYTLPENETLERTIASGFSELPLSVLAARVANAAFRADCYENGSINAMEVFLYKTRTHIVNSRGIDKTETKYHAMIEAIPTWNTAEESVELYEQYVFAEPDEAEITAEIDRKMKEVAYRSAAKKPEVMPSCRVVLQSEELATIAWELTDQLHYGSVYAHSNAFSKGDALQKEICGDVLNITLKSEQAGCCDGAVFDGDGVTLRDTEIIRDGKAIAYYGSNRFAQYLGEPITGDLPCLTMDCGSLTDDALAKQPYFLVVSMSGLQLDIYSDYIGGEVRLAYYVENGTVTPMTGISISGKLSDALSSVRLSNRATARRSYYGPALAAFDGITVV